MALSRVEEDFIKLVNAYIESETKVEITRQVLIERKDFDAYSCYRSIAQLDPLEGNGISRHALKAFMSRHHISGPESDINLLFHKLDKDGDGFINWNEFLDLTVSRETPCDMYHGNPLELSAELEHS